MFVKFNQPGKENKNYRWNIGNTTYLKRGDNDVPNDQWNKVKNNPTVIQKIKEGILEAYVSKVSMAEEALKTAKAEEALKTAAEEAESKPRGRPVTKRNLDGSFKSEKSTN